MRNRKDGFDEFLDAFIEEAIESNKCYCGGGGNEDKLDVVVEFGRRSDVPAAKLGKMLMRQKENRISVVHLNLLVICIPPNPDKPELRI
jgi:uncharacterized protein YggL (DUF469 family)